MQNEQNPAFPNHAFELLEGTWRGEGRVVRDLEVLA